MQKIYEIIKSASSDETINKENESIGESDLVSLLIKTLYGGSIIRITSSDKTHYCNVILDRIVDYSDETLETSNLSVTSITEISESELLTDETIKSRYLAFLENVQQILKRNYMANIKTNQELKNALRSKGYNDIEVTDYFDAGAFEFVGFSLVGISGRVSFEYMRDKDEGQILLPRKATKEKAKYKSLPLSTVEQVFYLARENADTLQESKVLEKAIKRTIED